MADVVKVSWSGGKDSTAAMLLHLQAGHCVKAVCFVPMLTDDIPLIMPDHYKYILDTAKYFRLFGASVDIVRGISYYDHVHTVISRGKNKGKFRGIGLGFGFCVFRNYSKIPALQKCDVGYYDYWDIGIGADEFRRIGQLTNLKRSILCEYGLTEKDAFQICYDYHLLSPIYFGSSKRDGCSICPNSRINEFLAYIKAYPDAERVLLDIEKFCKCVRPELSPYRNSQWFSDRLQFDYQYSLFEEVL